MSEKSRNSLHQPLAIVGMACRLPGADNLDAYWQLLQSGGSAIGPMPESKLDRRLYFHEEKGRRGKTYSDQGGEISQREIDWSLMPLPESEAGSWDPSHLILCEVAAQACRHAGYDPNNLPKQRTGVYVGHSGGSTLGGDLAYRVLAQDYVSILDSVSDWRDQPEHGRHALTEELLDLLRTSRPERDIFGKPLVDAGFAAGLISRALGLNGPHLVIDAACASSLVALALGAASLASGQVDMALVAGASFNKCDSLILFSQAQSCSAKASRPFDAAADGLISSEGYVTLVLKRLEAAQVAGDRIHAIVRGIGLSSDGRGRSLWAPRKEGQLAAIRRAYSEDVQPSSIQMIEAHATSTQVGDATEMDALATFFKEQLPDKQRLPVGSVKSNIGHTLETAGLAGLVKAVLAMQHGVIPPSINVTKLNDSIPWNEIPLFVPRVCQPWPALPSGCARRAAINAFGIGGLNVHVVVEHQALLASSARHEHGATSQPQRLAHAREKSSPAPKAANLQREPMAIIGRGVVLPGALSIDAFRRLLEQRTVRIEPPPTHRWRSEPQVEVRVDGQPHAVTVAGGFIDDFQYDWRKHKIPPKQIAQANPLQFMLLEAAEQAMREADYMDRQAHRNATAVVVGSAFGGEFGNALHAGLRLPEFRDRLLTLLQRKGWDKARAVNLADQYEVEFLKQVPALLDETGSFTSSTLASRLSKTFDLMGGAMAVDAGDASGLAALDVACLLLESRAVSHVLCAAANRAMDRAAFECLALHQRLPQSSSSSIADHSTATREGYYPGEGVAVLLLKRLSDAQKDGDKIIATVQAVSAGFDAKSVSKSVAIAARRIAAVKSTELDRKAIGGLDCPSLDQAISTGLSEGNLHGPLESGKSLQLIGHLQAAQGLVNIIEATLDQSATISETLIANSTVSGLSYCALVQTASTSRLPSGTSHLPGANTSRLPGGMSEPSQSAPTEPIVQTPNGPNWRIAHLTAGSAEQLRELLLTATSNPAQITMRDFHQTMTADSSWRASCVFCSEDECAGRMKTLSAQLGNNASRIPLAEQGMFWTSPEMRRGKVAWLFPGQGSQYPGMFRNLVARFSHAAEALKQANLALEKIGQPTFEQIAWDDSSMLGDDVWHTQLSVLIGDWIMSRVLCNWGIRADVIAGHSYGELPAMLAAGCWDFETALWATWHRCQSIVNHSPSGCAMLSIHADQDTVRRWIAESGAQVSISHMNAPLQTVVGGKRAAVAQLAQLIDSEGIGSRLLAVPTAFHTPYLRAAQQPFADLLESIPLQPPRTGLLSSVTNRYVSDPIEMRAGLVAQLVQPIDFIGLVKRLEKDGVTLAVEVGPQQVLTKLVRQSASHRLQVVPTDNPKRGTEFQLRCVQAACIAFGAASHGVLAQLPGLERVFHLQEPQTQPVRSVSAPQPVVHFDATEIRRLRMKATAASSRLPGPSRAGAATVTRPVHFDATQTRNNATPLHVGPMSNQPGARGADSDAGLGNAQAFEASLMKSEPLVLASGKLDACNTALTPEASACELLPAASACGSLETPLSSSRTSSIEAFLIDFVVEQTGYPPGIIELDWDIEADLGIDSIKKAQLFGELREFFDLEAHRRLALDDFRTLRDIVRLLEGTPGKGDWIAHQPTASADVQVSWPSALQTVPSPREVATSLVQNRAEIAEGQLRELALGSDPNANVTHGSGLAPNVTDGSGPASLVTEDSRLAPTAHCSAKAGSLNASQVEQFLIDFVVEQTGYPPDIVELDADLEADLGIDSIKKAQLLGELREMFSLADNSSNGSRLSLADYRTLRQILELLVQNQPAGNSSVKLHPTSPASHAGNSMRDSLPQGTDASSAHPIARPTLNRMEPTDQHEVLGKSSPGECRLPVIIWFDDRARVLPHVPNSFEMTLNQNLLTMAGRRLESESLRWPTLMTNLSPDTDARLQAISRCRGIAIESLVALDRCLTTETCWEPSELAPKQDSSRNGSAPARNWLLKYYVPHWLLNGGGCPIGLSVHANSTRRLIGIATPGELVPRTFLTEEGWLVSAAVLESRFASLSRNKATDSSASKYALAELLHRALLKTDTVESLIDASGHWGLEHDWWLQLAELGSQRMVSVAFRQGKRVVEQSTLAGSEYSTGAILPADAAAGIGYDSLRRELVISSRIEGPLYLPVDTVFSIDESGCGITDWLARTIAAGQKMSEDQAGNVTEQVAPSNENIERDREGESYNVSKISSETVADRYVLRMCPAPLPIVPGRMPSWTGAALVVGSNPVARQLEARLKGVGVEVYSLPVSDDPMALSIALDTMWECQPVTHLFLTSACDAGAAISTDDRAWQLRKHQGILGPYWLCQNWLRKIKDARLTDDSSLVAISSMGGDFGLQGHLHSAEGGGLAGLLKSIFIESWVEGYRTLPIKVLDTHADQSPAQVVDELWRELSVPSFDIEVSYRRGTRHVIRAISQPVPPHRETIAQSGNWICTGGARGITAFVAENLAKRYGLRLHLLGTRPLPEIDSQWHALDAERLRKLKSQVMTQARLEGKNPIQTWQDTEKTIEIDATLRRLAAQGIEAHYHCCDVSDRQAVHQTLARVREISGPIEGILHGAGVGKDARFDQKQPHKVLQCIDAKVTGALALFEATQHDPLRYFVGFGSISGRFGANGHSDYSLANDMLCKQIDWLRSLRPEIAAVGIHWHAWGDVGMATKPETKLALEMIDMQFMPAHEGLERLIDELECGAPEGEVLITDERYYRLFYPAETMTVAAQGASGATNVSTPLLECEVPASDGTWRSFKGVLRPAKDPFLVEHRLDGTPLLPIVIGCEMLIEGARAQLGRVEPFELRDVEAIQGLRCFTKEPLEFRVQTRSLPEDRIECRLTSDFYARDGRLVQANRINLKGTVVPTNGQIPTEQSPSQSPSQGPRLCPSRSQGTRVELPVHVAWKSVEYPQPNDKFYVGSPLQKLRKVAILDGALVGKISAPVLIELAGGARSVVGWQIPCAAMDACLFATGILAWQQVAAGSALPVRFGRLRFGRLPSPGEACEVHVKFKSMANGRACFDFTLYGVNGDTLLDAMDYQVAWLASESLENSMRRSHVHQ